MTEIKQPTRIDFTTGKFKANGHDYYISNVIPVGRDLIYTKLVPQLAFGTDFAGIMGFARDIYNHATTGESPLGALHKIATSAINFMDAVKNIGENGYPLYYHMAAIFINRVGEDPTILTEEMINEKIQDWEKEGIPREDFFLLAISSIKGLSQTWQELQAQAEATMLK